MSIPKGTEVETQAQSAGGAAPSPTEAPCPSGDVPKEGSRDIQQKGKIISVPYDWCKSTDSPVPYRIWAWQSSGSNLANTVRQTDCRSHVLGSIVNQCYGDEPGTGGGVKSGTNLAECTPLSASPTVRAEDKPMVRYLDKWWMNHKNTWGCLNNSEDMGKYDPPKLQSIDAKLSPIPSKEEDQQALANGTQVAQIAPSIPLTPSTPVDVPNPVTVLRPLAPLAPYVGAGAAAAASPALSTGVGLVGVSRGQATVDDAANAAAGLPAQTRTPIMGLPMDLNPAAPGTGAIPVYPNPLAAPTDEQIDKAYAKNQAQALAAAQVKPNTWVRITSNPCFIFACPAAPLPSYQYKGGTYACVKGSGNEGHHTPAASVSYLPPSAGPAVQMDPADHTLTASYGSKATSAFYRTAQGGLISSGNFMGAVGMDVADLSQSKFHHKYDGAVAQMLLYANCLKKYGFVR